MKNHYRKINRRKLRLGDLVSVVSSCTRNERETVATLIDLLGSGRVRIRDHGHLKRVKFSPAFEGLS